MSTPKSTDSTVREINTNETFKRYVMHHGHCDSCCCVAGPLVTDLTQPILEQYPCPGCGADMQADDWSWIDVTTDTLPRIGPNGRERWHTLAGVRVRKGRISARFSWACNAPDQSPKQVALMFGRGIAVYVSLLHHCPQDMWHLPEYLERWDMTGFEYTTL